MSNGLLLAGDVYVDLLEDNNAGTGLIGPINTTKLAITSNSESKKRPSTKKATFGQALDSVPIPQPSTIGWDFDDVAADILAAVMLGNVNALNTGAGALTDEPITLPTNQRWAELGQVNFADAAFSVKEGANVLTLGTDYEVNYADGLIRAVKGGAVEAGGAILVTGTYIATTGSRITGGTKSQIKARILLKGKNLTNGKAINLEVPIAVLTPDGEIDFMNSEFVTGSMSGDIVLATGATAPYIYDEIA